MLWWNSHRKNNNESRFQGICVALLPVELRAFYIAMDHRKIVYDKTYDILFTFRSKTYFTCANFVSVLCLRQSQEANNNTTITLARTSSIGKAIQSVYSLEHMLELNDDLL